MQVTMCSFQIASRKCCSFHSTYNTENWIFFKEKLQIETCFRCNHWRLPKLTQKDSQKKINRVVFVFSARVALSYHYLCRKLCVRNFIALSMNFATWFGLTPIHFNPGFWQLASLLKFETHGREGKRHCLGELANYAIILEIMFQK